MKSVLLLSGGIDSTVLLADRHRQGDGVIPITFDYGQTHRREILAAKAIAAHYGTMTRVIKLPHIFGPSALLGDETIPDEHASRPDTTTVPARNLVMLSVGAAIAEAAQAPVVFVGANLDDAAGYVDCRPEFIRAIDDAVGLGTGNGVHISAPLLSSNKADIIAYGRSLDAPLHLTWSCYRGGEQQCGNCGACHANRVPA